MSSTLCRGPPGGMSELRATATHGMGALPACSLAARPGAHATRGGGARQAGGLEAGLATWLAVDGRAGPRWGPASACRSPRWGTSPRSPGGKTPVVAVASMAHHWQGRALAAEGIGARAVVPLVTRGRLLG
jgi:hypothetical protein